MEKNKPNNEVCVSNSNELSILHINTLQFIRLHKTMLNLLTCSHTLSDTNRLGQQGKVSGSARGFRLMYKWGKEEKARGPAHINLLWPEEATCICTSLHLSPSPFLFLPSALPPYSLRTSPPHFLKINNPFFFSPALPFTLFHIITPSLSAQLKPIPHWHTSQYPPFSPLSFSHFLKDVKCVKGVLDTWWVEVFVLFTNSCFNTSRAWLTVGQKR